MNKIGLNHAYRLVWSDVHQAFIAVAEFARGRGKKSSAVRLLATSLLFSGAIQAAEVLPSGGNVVAGTGTISQSGSAMTIHQNTGKLAIDWQSFNIGQGNTVNFVQPSASSVAMNRVLGSDVSVIQGALNANGQVFLINPNGVLFTKDAQVNVGGIVASTLNISTADFMAGNYKFEGNSSNAVINQGNITTAPGGTVALIAAKITNTGTLTAEQGNVLLGAGSKVTLDLGGPVRIEVTQGAIDALIEQGGAIKADGGLVYLTAKAAGDLVTTVINHTGITEARTLTTGEKGEIYLMGDMAKGRINVGGTLDASAPNGGDGGFIETSAAKVAFANGVNITTAAANGKTGQWLIDPVDFTVAASGGDITGSALGGLLDANSVTIQTANAGTNSATDVFGATGSNGDIFVNDSVSWSTTNTLTLNAHRNIEINAAIDAWSGGRLVLEYGQGAAALNNTASYIVRAPIYLKKSGLVTGSNGTTATKFATKLGSDGTAVNWTVITELGTAGAGASTASGTLQGIRHSTAQNGNFVLGADIDATSTSTWNTNQGFTPILSFKGLFDGLGHTIDNLTINRPTTDYVGLFGSVSDGAGEAAVRNLGVTNANITGQNNVGILAGYFGSNVTTENNYASNVYSSGSVTGVSNVGGLIGSLLNYSGNTTSGLFNAHSSASVVGTAAVTPTGGLVGLATTSRIINSYATGTVQATNAAGGLVGNNTGSQISQSYASGNVIGVVNGATESDNLGGLVGYNTSSGVVYGTITDSYATGKVTATANGTSTGGLVGQNNVNNSITRSYASGKVTGGDATKTGGLVGDNAGNVTDSYWDSDTTTQAAAFGTNTTGQSATAVTSAGANPDAYTQPTYSGFDFGNTWWMAGLEEDPLSSGTYQVLQGLTRPMLRSEWSPVITNAHQLQLVSTRLNASYILANDIDLAPSLANASEVWRDSDQGSSFQGSFAPIAGPGGEYFVGQFNGRPRTFTGAPENDPVYTISNLHISLPSDSEVVGLFGGVQNATIKDLTLAGGSVTGGDSVGGLAGFAGGTTSISGVTASVDVTGGTYVGGLVGYVLGDGGHLSITNSSASGDVTGTGTFVGGLIGQVFTDNDADAITLSENFATGNVSGKTGTGGLIGSVYGDTDTTLETTRVTVSQSYATGNVNGGNDEASGGLIGDVWGVKAALEDVYASGSVSNGINSGHGGLIGYLNAESTLTRAYATGAVNVTNGGGLIGTNDDDTGSNVTLSYWDKDTSGKTTSAGGTGKTTAEMKNGALYSGWNNFGWTIAQGRGQAVAGYEVGEGLAYLTDVTQVSDRPTQTTSILFDGGWGGLNNSQQAGADGTPYGISTWDQLANIRRVASSGYSYLQNNDLDATSTGYAAQVKDGSTLANGGLGWVPIGSVFKGVYDGGNFSISGLIMNASSGSTGLFGTVSQINGSTLSRIENLTLVAPDVTSTSGSTGALVGSLEGGELNNVHVDGGSVTGAGNVGGLVGSSWESTDLVTNSDSSATVSGTDTVGGLVGTNSGTVTNSHAIGAVTASLGLVGGLVGRNGYDAIIEDSYAEGDVVNTGGNDNTGGLVGASGTGSLISNSYATGNVAATTANRVGGLVGSLGAGTVEFSYATGTVRGAEFVGGLVGSANGGTTSRATISSSYASGGVIGTGQQVGGLVGESTATYIANTFASGNVSGTDKVGGLVGLFQDNTNDGTPTISNSYAFGVVTGTTNVGGLVGSAADPAMAVNSYWDTETTGQSTSPAGTGKTTAQLRDIATFTGWDIADDQNLGVVVYPELTMNAAGNPVWKIKSVASGGGDTGGGTGGGDTGGGTGGGDTGGSTGGESVQEAAQQESAIASAQAAAGAASDASSSGGSGQGAGLGLDADLAAMLGGSGNLGGSGTAGTAGDAPQQFGGLAFLNVKDAPEASGQGGNPTGSVPNEGGGRDLAGFMRVFVVNGGLNLPEQASDTAEANAGGQNAGGNDNTRNRRRGAN